MRRLVLTAALATACLTVAPARAEAPPSTPLPPSTPAAPSPPPPPSTPPSIPPNVEDARKHYARGVELYEQGADAASLAELERAFELAPNWKLLYELGVVELAVHDFAAALKYFEQYLSEGGSAIRSVRRQEVTDHIDQLRREVATIELTTKAGAEITLDDATVGTAPLPKPLVVNPGHHKLSASKDGLVAESRAISVAEGDHAHIELDIPESPPPPSPPVLSPPQPLPSSATAPSPPSQALPPRPSPPPAPPIWLGWVATGALVAGAIVTGIEALDANSSLTQAKADAPATPGTLSSLSSRAHAFAAACDAMTAVAIVTSGVTLYFTLPPPPRPAPAGEVSVGIGLGRVSVGATF